MSTVVGSCLRIDMRAALLHSLHLTILSKSPSGTLRPDRSQSQRNPRKKPLAAGAETQGPSFPIQSVKRRTVGIGRTWRGRTRCSLSRSRDPSLCTALTRTRTHLRDNSCGRKVNLNLAYSHAAMEQGGFLPLEPSRATETRRELPSRRHIVRNIHSIGQVMVVRFRGFSHSLLSACLLTATISSNDLLILLQHIVTLTKPLRTIKSRRKAITIITTNYIIHISSTPSLSTTRSS